MSGHREPLSPERIAKIRARAAELAARSIEANDAKGQQYEDLKLRVAVLGIDLARDIPDLLAEIDRLWSEREGLAAQVQKEAAAWRALAKARATFSRISQEEDAAGSPSWIDAATAIGDAATELRALGIEPDEPGEKGNR